MKKFALFFLLAILASPLGAIPSDRGLPASGLTGFFNWGVSPEWIAVVVLVLALLGVVYHRFYYSAARLRKSFNGKRVRIELSAGRRELEDVVLTDYAPEDAPVSGFNEKPSVSETVTGKVLKWRKPLLRSNEIWAVEYELDAGGERLKKAEATADSDGKRISLLS